MPDSAADVDTPLAGVGFGDYEAYSAERDADLAGEDDVLAAARAALEDGQSDAAARNSGVKPLEASPSNPAPSAVSNAVGISGENDFETVSENRDIEADAALIARNREQYQVIEPTALPTRSGSDRPNIVAYALRTTNPVGVPLYRRIGFNAGAQCAKLR